jgi:orotate phosphoribosyltransferase
MEAEILERINRGIILRTGAYLTNDHFVLPSGRHAQEYVEKALATTEPAFTEGLGGVIAKHFADQPIDLVITTGYGASLLGHCVARAHPLRPRFIYANKQRDGSGASQVSLPREFRQYFAGDPRVLIVEDILTTGETVKGLIDLVKSLGGRVVGIGTLWRRSKKVKFKFTSRLTPKRDEEASAEETGRGMPISSEVVFRTTVANVGGRTIEYQWVRTGR